jgi:hypothetical protein
MAEGLAGGLGRGWTAGALSGVAFDPALLYVLIGGPDYLRFLVPERLVPFSYVVIEFAGSGGLLERFTEVPQTELGMPVSPAVRGR